MDGPWLFPVGGAVVGACLGSFAVTAAIRLTRGEPFLTGRSHCDDCDVALSFVETLPLVGYVRRVGLCGRCGAAIDPAHLFGEAAGAVIVGLALLLAPLSHAVPVAALGLVLMASAVVDAKTQRLPNVLTLAAGLIGLGLAAERSQAALWIGLCASAIAFAVLAALRWSYVTVRGRPGLGMGDVKLIAALAAWLGLLTPWAVALAAIAGLIFVLVRGRPHERVAFGPALAAAGWLVGLTMEAGLWPTLAI
jgi:leader peptidase (prepilin peptidase)/N-methyltransferase